jgi:hypothetical protein
MAKPAVVKNAKTTNTVISLNLFIIFPPFLCFELPLKIPKSRPAFQKSEPPMQTTEAIVGNAVVAAS